MIDISLDKTTLFIRRGISSHVARPGRRSIVVIVCPLVEMIGKFKTTSVGSRIFKIDDDELLVFVGGLKKW